MLMLTLPLAHATCIRTSTHRATGFACLGPFETFSANRDMGLRFLKEGHLPIWVLVSEVFMKMKGAGKKDTDNGGLKVLLAPRAWMV